MLKIEVRIETHADKDSIWAVTERAFRDMPYADGDEQDVIDRLRKKNALTISLVAALDGSVVGHVAFSPATNQDLSSPWFALGPVSVLPEFQKKGIGSELINTGIQHLKQIDALGCILTGNPAYYRKFGFEVSPEYAPSNEPGEFFMLKLFGSKLPGATFRFHDAFYGEKSTDAE